MIKIWNAIRRWFTDPTHNAELAACDLELERRGL